MPKQGTIRKIINKVEDGRPRAFGFIRMDDGQEVFFLPSHLQLTQNLTWDDLHEGERVEFETTQHPKGLRAVDVRVLRTPPPRK